MENSKEAIQFIPVSKQKFVEQLNKMGNLTLFPNHVNGCLFIEKKTADIDNIWTLKFGEFWFSQQTEYKYNLTRFTQKESYDPYQYSVNISCKLLSSAN